MKTKICTKCKQEKNLSGFSLDKYKKSGLTSSCKECRKVQSKQWQFLNPKKYQQSAKNYRLNNPEKVAKSVWNTKLKTKYGITEKEFDSLYTKQNGLCAICGKPEFAKTPQGNIRPLSIDHHHLNKTVRGLLCSKCNCAIGLLDIDNQGGLLLQKAIDYINGNHII